MRSHVGTMKTRRASWFRHQFAASKGALMRYARYALAAALMVTPAVAQDVQPTNDAPNPFTTVKEYFKLPAGRSWGSTSAVDIDKDGKSIWIAERCGQNSCLDRTAGKMMDVPTVMKFDANGTLVTSFGAGMLIFPHGIHVDRDGNVWVTDGQDNAPLPQRGAGGGGAGGGRARGKVLLTLGKPGGAAAPDYFYQPNDVVTAPNGDIFVSEGHGAGNNRILKFDKTGKFIKEWGKLGTGPGEFDQPHALAFDGQGRLFVGDRNNNRVQVFDQDGKYITEYKQFSRPSGIFIKGDILYVADSESESVSQNHNGWHRGIRMGSIKDGRIQGFIPDPETRTRAADNFTGTSAAEGVAVDAAGNIYGAEVGPKAVKKYVKK